MVAVPNSLIIGGGPAGLYFSILIKKAFPETRIRVVERNKPEDTFGWGVVFSDETLGNFESADPESYAEIARSFTSWRNIETHVRGAATVSTGHGFAALERKTLLLLLHRRCRELGVELQFEHEVASLDSLGETGPVDLIVAADGANSWVRQALAAQFEPEIRWGRCRFCWLGADFALPAFTFIFEETGWGLFQVHAYPFTTRQSTWIVECHEEVWRRAGLDSASEEDTVAFCERVFAAHLRGRRLLTNRSLWRSFPTVRCARWSAQSHGTPVVLLGDAAHTAHFSVGSGTKLAMEDSIALAEAFQRAPGGSVGAALADYEASRRVDVAKLQRAAQTSREWFENSARYLGQPPLQLTFNLMTRSKRITYDNLGARDPQLIQEINAWYAREHGGRRDAPAPPIFTPFSSRGLELANRIVISPMCQYSAAEGLVNNWHLVHLGSRAVGGAGLVMTEMTDVSPEGRITLACAGMWSETHAAAWRRIVEFVHQRSGAKIGIQLAHAGRKGSVHHPWEGEDTPLGAEEGAWQTLGPSALPFKPDWPVPKAMDRADMDAVIAEFVRASAFAQAAGFDLIELHMAHGYLLSSFLSPLSNHRTDEYGGSLENRARFPVEVLAAVRAAWPADKPLWARISATDWMDAEGGFTADEAVTVSRWLHEAGCDLIDVSSAGNSPLSRPDYGRMYQVPFAEKIRHEANVPVAAVGAIQDADQANTILAAGRADLIVMARPHLKDPYLTLHAAERYGLYDIEWPGQYLLAKPRPPKSNS